jgi:hypothetical protein
VGTHAIPVLPEILIQVIQHNRNWGATAAGQSPWSVIRKEIFYRAHGDNKFKGNESVKTPSEHDILPEKDY